MVPAPDAAVEVLVRDNPEKHRYEAFVGDVPAGFADYHLQPGIVTVLHTEIDPTFEGQGVGSVFVRGLLDDIRARGAKALPVCPFVLAFLKRHDDYADLVWRP